MSILFTHIVNFPAYINESKPMNVIELLNLLFSVYDQLVKTHNAYKVSQLESTRSSQVIKKVLEIFICNS